MLCWSESGSNYIHLEVSSEQRDCVKGNWIKPVELVPRAVYFLEVHSCLIARRRTSYEGSIPPGTG